MDWFSSSKSFDWATRTSDCQSSSNELDCLSSSDSASKGMALERMDRDCASAANASAYCDWLARSMAFERASIASRNARFNASTSFEAWNDRATANDCWSAFTSRSTSASKAPNAFRSRDSSTDCCWSARDCCSTRNSSDCALASRKERAEGSDESSDCAFEAIEWFEFWESVSSSDRASSSALSQKALASRDCREIWIDCDWLGSNSSGSVSERSFNTACNATPASSVTTT